MKWSLVITGSLILVLIFMFEWPRMRKIQQKKDKVVFFSFLLAGWMLSLFLSIYPDASGPTQWVEAVFRPFGKILEK